MDDFDVTYYKHRVVTERRMAACASKGEVALIHAELARQYQALVDQQALSQAVKSNPVLRLLKA